MAWPIHPQVGEFAESLAFIPADAPTDRWHMPVAAREINSETELLNLMVSDHSVTSMATISGLFPDFYLPNNFHSWNQSLTLVIGDSVTDRLCFWNSRLLYGTWRLGGLIPLRIPAARLDDIEFMDALVAYVARRNWVSANGDGANRVTLRSASIDPAQLQILAAHFQKTRHVLVTVEPITSVTDCVPSKDRLNEAQPWRNEAPSHFVSDSPFVIDCPQPKHVLESAYVPPILKTGSWAMDVKIERHDTQSPFSNALHWWKLPRQWEIVQLFSTKGRVNRWGEITVLPHDGTTGPFLRPAIMAQFSTATPDEEVVMSLFLKQPYLAPRETPLLKVERPYSGVQPWDKGRYLNGLIGLFGSLAAAYRVLADGFWQKTFMEMASPSRNSTERKRQQVLSALKAEYKRKERKETVTEPEEWASLVEAAIRITPRRLKNPTAISDYETLLEKWQAALAEHADHEPNLLARQTDIQAESEGDLQNSIERRCQEGVLAQGHRWNCHHCLHTNWASVSSISPILTCEICRTERPLPADFRWHFYLNDFLAEGLREHGMLGLVWCLGQLQYHAKESFFFAPPLALYREIPADRRAAPDKEVDICCVVDGQFVVGEVKESDREINDALGDDLIQLAKDVQADKVVIACLAPAAQKRVNQQVSRIAQSLTEIGCDVEGMVPDSSFGAAAHYLA
jgi:hypothetical protein